MKSRNKNELGDFIKTQIKGLSSIPKENSEELIKNIINILVKKEGKVVISGIGKSGFVGKKIASTFLSFGLEASFLHPVEAFHGDLGMVRGCDTLICVSNSGETKELLRLLNNIPSECAVVTITGNKKSSLAEKSQFVLSYKVEDEGSPHNLAPMSSVIAAMAVGDFLAGSYAKVVNFSKKNFSKFHPSGFLNLKAASVATLMKSGKDIPKVSPSSSLKELIREMSGKKLGVTLVLEKGVLKGIITDGDLRRFFERSDFSFSAKAEKIMTKNPASIDKEKSLKEALDILEKKKITTLPVMDKKRIVGILHLHDVISYGKTN
ncbi:MAG: KpsF/GutQ family sugar-phosphate isomerase [Candidatus Harrisonbacteria bacterium]|nr:KpsF/GutQ family sugar-phosphate isomerase [Candidatus Harrisonbacteria bacterium]